MAKDEEATKNERPVTSEPYYPSLPNVETVGYFTLYFGCVFYSVSLVYGVSKANEYRYSLIGNLESSQWLKGKLKDSSDDQWMMMTKFMCDVYLKGLTGHFILARIVETCRWKKRFQIFSIYGIGFTIYFFGLPGTLFIILHSLIQYIVAKLSKNTVICWITGFLLCLSLVDSVSSEESYLNFTFSQLVRPYQSDDDKADYLIYVAAMCNLRSIAFSLEYVWSQNSERQTKNIKSEIQIQIQGTAKETSESTGVRKRKSMHTSVSPERSFVALENVQQPFKDHQFSFFDLLIFQFYYPLMYGGPVMSYRRFVKESNETPLTWSFQNFVQFAFGVFRFVFWIMFIEVTLHFYYLPSLSSEARIINDMSSFFPAFGLGVAQVGFFYIKHVILYGLPSHIAASDNFNAPKGPHCVYSKHRLTDMWKTFDQGLHEWLVRYMYLPLGGSKVKFYQLPINSFLPFFFTAVWHGGDYQYIHWAFLSWAGVFAEGIALKLYQTNFIKKYESKYLTMEWSRRLRGIFSSVMFGATLTIDVYFQSGMEIGNAYWNKFYHESFLITFLFHFTYYTGVQCCMELHRLKITID